MEEFKIIKLPSKEDDETEKEYESPPKSFNEGEYRPPKKRYLVIIIFIILLIIGYYIMRIVSTYSDYDVEESYDREDSAESSYLDFDNNILKYSSDGIFYTTYKGDLIWNYTYDMSNPGIDTCGDYIVVYDIKGSEVDIFSTSGYITSISSTIPIMQAQIADQGTVALLLQESGVSYIQMYGLDGTLLVSGELHPENKGFPISMALSSDATRLLLSAVTIEQGELSTQLTFYDFTSVGKEKEDNIVSTYTYLDMLIPKVDYIKGDKAIAFGDSKIIVFNSNTQATIAKEISLSTEAKSIFYNDSYYGYVCETTDSEGNIVNELNVYNLYGFRCVKKEFDESYEEISILDSNEILINDNGSISIYNMQGFKKFTYDFDESVYAVIPANTSRKYYIIEENKTEKIYIK